MPNIENIDCYITTPAGRLVEYAQPISAPDDGPALGDRSRTVYIPSTSDTPFTINLLLYPDFSQAHREANGLSITVFLDGVPYTLEGYTSFDKSHLSYDTVFSRDHLYIHSLQFAKLETTDDDRYKDPSGARNLAELGEIKVEVRRFYKTGTQLAPPGRVPLAEVRLKEERKPVHEKALKGRDLTHVAKLGEGRPRADLGRQRAQIVGMRLDPEDVPYMTFRFLYRSERALKYLGLLPRTPSPERSVSPELVPIEVSRDRLEALTRRQLMDRVRELEAQSQTRGIKRERDSDSPVKVKAEDSIEKRRKKTEYVDLTDD